MTMLDLNPLFARYRLYSVGPFVLERTECVCLAVFFLAGVLSVLCLFCSVRRRPFYQKHRIERLIEYTLCRMRAALCHMPGRCFEWYKLARAAKGIVRDRIFCGRSDAGGMAANVCRAADHAREQGRIHG